MVIPFPFQAETRTAGGRETGDGSDLAFNLVLLMNYTLLCVCFSAVLNSVKFMSVL